MFIDLRDESARPPSGGPCGSFVSGLHPLTWPSLQRAPSFRLSSINMALQTEGEGPNSFEESKFVGHLNLRSLLPPLAF